jgi:pulcherriminic acid synthase
MMTGVDDLGSTMELPDMPDAPRDGSGFRTYEVYQRQRVRDATPLIRPRQLASVEYLVDPYPIVAILREHYPCYRDWASNSFWVSRYDDVTSVFVDEANFESRSKLWYYGASGFGRDLRDELAVAWSRARAWDTHAVTLADQLASELAASGRASDLATEFVARYAIELLARWLDLPAADVAEFGRRYLAMQRGYHWEPRAAMAGRVAMDELVAYFAPLLAARRGRSGQDLISVVADLDLDDGAATAADVVVTLLEDDHETLHGALANLWYVLLTHPDQYVAVRDDRRLVRFAYQETLRHSAPVVMARRFTRHEVERFGRLLPEGAMVILSAAAANRDPRQFEDPDRFDVTRTDICQREPRGSYRADGLPAGVSFGTGRPSRLPAVPEDRPRSLWALTRDTAVSASQVLLDRFPHLALADTAGVGLRSLRWGEMHTCWSLPVTW